MGATAEPETVAALQILNLSQEASWDDIRRTFREQIRLCHPDLVGDTEAARTRSSALNQAFGHLEHVTQRGTVPLGKVDGAKQRSAIVPGTDTRSDPIISLNTPTDDVFMHLVEAAHEFGDVSYVSPSEEMVQVLVSPPEGERYQLLISIVANSSPPQVQFSLDSLTSRPAAPIEHVVQQFSKLLSS